MPLHEKTFELNITHELLNLADSWSWFLSDISLWKYWRPRYRLPLFDLKPGLATGLHINIEGKNDPTGESGGGYDVRIQTHDGRLLFVQYKNSVLESASPDPQSIFNTPPHAHLAFGINNNNKKDQHVLLQNLANSIGSRQNNAVVYAFPLFADMQEVIAASGKLLRKTKFVSVADIDAEASKKGITIIKGKKHHFRVCRIDENRCELNDVFIPFLLPDRTDKVVAEALAIRFERILRLFFKEVALKAMDLDKNTLSIGLRYAYIHYLKFLHQYFDVSIRETSFYDMDWAYTENYDGDSKEMESSSDKRDIGIVNAILSALTPYTKFIDQFTPADFQQAPPAFQPSLFIAPKEPLSFTLDHSFTEEDIENIGYLLI